jgi:4-amino-4-deoxy-L-arabinose transferase-like glycosyltransferase
MFPSDSPDNKSAVFVAAVLAFITAGLVFYANTAAFAWDEGYHLIAAWLIAHGKQPYIDFVFPQTPNNAYWNAALLRVFGESWRVPHTAGASLTSIAIAMSASYVYQRLDLPQRWRASAAIATAVIIGLNTAIVDFDSLQAYGLCLVMIVSAYLLTVASVDRPGILRPAAAGLCSGIAAASSLLTAPVGPILLVWMLIVNRTGGRIKKLIAFCAGVIVAFIPLLRLLIKAPHPVIFGFLQYQLLYRKVEWDDASIHNLGEVLSWGNSSQGVLLVLLAAAGILFIRKNPPNSRLKRELYLCGALALIIGAYLLTARPTFTRYFLLTVPFLAIPAAYGLYEITERLATPPRPWLAATILCLLTAYGLGDSLFSERDDMMWKDIAQTANKVSEVTPPNAVLLADEMVYFLLHRTPISGTELEDSHKLTLSDAEAKALHVLPRPKLDLMIKAHRFDTVEMCDDDEITRLSLATLYAKSAKVGGSGDCQVFWQWVDAPAK